jgi:hypothetical protein
LKGDKDNVRGEKEETSVGDQVQKRMDVAFAGSRKATAKLLNTMWLAIPETVGFSFLYVIFHGVVKYVLPIDPIDKFFCRYSEEWVPDPMEGLNNATGNKLDKVTKNGEGSGSKSGTNEAGSNQKMPGMKTVQKGRDFLEKGEQGIVLFVTLILIVFIGSLLMLVAWYFSLNNWDKFKLLFEIVTS